MISGSIGLFSLGRLPETPDAQTKVSAWGVLEGVSPNTVMPAWKSRSGFMLHLKEGPVNNPTK